MAGWVIAAAACSASPAVVGSADSGAGDAAVEASSPSPVAGTAVPDPPDTGCAVSIDSDPKNCGACGRDCLGSACLKGLCRPELVATALKDPWYLALDAANVYWTDVTGGAITRVDKAGLTAPIELAVAESGPFAVAVDAAHVYWTNRGDGTIVRANKDDGGARTVLAMSDGPREIALDDASIYWSAEGSDASTGGVFRAAKDGAAPVALAPRGGSPMGLALAGPRVCWADHALGKIFVLPEAAGPAREIASGLASPSRLATDDARVFWLSDTDDAVQSAPLGGGPATTLATGKRVTIGGIAVDLTSVYWVNSGAGTLSRVAKSGGAPLTLAAGQVVPVAVAVDATHVYWTTRGGSIFRVAK